MGKITRRTGEEFKRLPLMLAKLAGGLAAVIGFGMAAWTATRNGAAIPGDTLSPVLLGCVGIAVFLLAARKMAGPSAGAPPGGGKYGQNILAWSLLLVFAFLFLAFSWFVTG